jgi:secreted trypsin-like serine protease
MGAANEGRTKGAVLADPSDDGQPRRRRRPGFDVEMGETTVRRRLSFAVILGALALAMAAPASAITFGELTGPAYGNVGALIYQEDDGNFYLYCTGTLIADNDGGDSNIFLTAAHCIPPEEVEGEGTRMWVSFDPALDIDPETGAVVGTPTMYAGTAYAHESFACCGFNNSYDIAVVVLDQDVANVTPAVIAEEGLLTSMTPGELRAANFIAVGYGTVRNDKTQGFAPFFFDGDRRWVEQSALSLTKSWLTLSMNPSTGDGGTCYGDSGGPHFLESNGQLILVSITVTGDIPCRATDKTYRIDTPDAQAFLAPFLAL